MGKNPLFELFLIAFFLNLPLGYIRQGHVKFSPKWFFWVHASIPFIIYFRISRDVSPIWIPLVIFFAVMGQIWGGRWRAKNMPPEEARRLKQLPEMGVDSRFSAVGVDPGFESQANNRGQTPVLSDSDTTVVLLNMGGPRANADVRDFQRRLFEDPILIRFPLSRFLQKFFAWLLITFRLKTAERRYRLIGGGSPIYPSTEAQVKALQEELKRRGRNLHVTYSFNYSPPLPEETIQELKRAGKKYILPLSLYPHYSKATTGSNLHYLRKAARKIYPELKFLPTPSYYLRDGYIAAFVDRVREQIQPGESLDDFYLLFSAHGLPLYFLTEGDPYPFQVAQTVAKILDRLNRSREWSVSYQSAVGPLRWLRPYTEDMLVELAARGRTKVLVVPVSFVTDHIETTCEIDIEYRALAERKGIRDFRMSKALECHPLFIEALAESVS